jgi:MerR family transcriptional regulator, thiopeptide resistance regulator
MKTVGEVAELAAVTVRTLHHYDELGLLSPSGRSDAGYRLYSRDDLARLREILIWRTLGFPLTEIASLLGDPGHDRLAALERQRELIEREIERLGALAAAVDAAIAAHRDRAELEVETMFEGFDPSEYEDEARERWGDTDAYMYSTRTGSYGQAEWDEIRGEAETIVRELVTSMRAGHAADGPEARALAERHRRHISRWFYPCSPQMHRGLAEMYVADERFTQTYEREAEGLAAYFHDAILANAAGNGQASAAVSR